MNPTLTTRPVARSTRPIVTERTPAPSIIELFHVVEALCDVGNWELARSVARAVDRRRAR